jgi:hypothetical protein
MKRTFTMSGISMELAVWERSNTWKTDSSPEPATYEHSLSSASCSPAEGNKLQWDEPSSMQAYECLKDCFRIEGMHDFSFLYAVRLNAGKCLARDRSPIQDLLQIT